MEDLKEFIGHLVAIFITVIFSIFTLYVIGAGFGIVIWGISCTGNLLGIW